MFIYYILKKNHTNYLTSRYNNYNCGFNLETALKINFLLQIVIGTIAARLFWKWKKGAIYCDTIYIINDVVVNLIFKHSPVDTSLFLSRSAINYFCRVIFDFIRALNLITALLIILTILAAKDVEFAEDALAKVGSTRPNACAENYVKWCSLIRQESQGRGFENRDKDDTIFLMENQYTLFLERNNVESIDTDSASPAVCNKKVIFLMAKLVINYPSSDCESDYILLKGIAQLLILYYKYVDNEIEFFKFEAAARLFCQNTATSFAPLPGIFVIQNLRSLGTRSFFYFVGSPLKVLAKMLLKPIQRAGQSCKEQAYYFKPVFLPTDILSLMGVEVCLLKKRRDNGRLYKSCERLLVKLVSGCLVQKKWSKERRVRAVCKSCDKFVAKIKKLFEGEFKQDAHFAATAPDRPLIYLAKVLAIYAQKYSWGKKARLSLSSRRDK